MDKDIAEMIRRVEATLDYKKMERLEEDAVERAMTGDDFSTSTMLEVWKRHPELAPPEFKELFPTKMRP